MLWFFGCLGEETGKIYALLLYGDFGTFLIKRLVAVQKKIVSYQQEQWLVQKTTTTNICINFGDLKEI